MKAASRFIPIAVLFILSFNTLAQVVEPDFARKIAAITFSELQKGSDTGTITGDSVIYDVLNQPLMYIFTESKGGFIIFSADKRTYPVLGWGDSGALFSGDMVLPPALNELIDNWKTQIDYCRTNYIIPRGEISDMWDRLESGEAPGLLGTKDVLPLLATKWSQGCGYNALCPADASGPCGHAVTGCVATAMAQVVRYNEHPLSGTGSRCYTSSRYGELCADFSEGTYDYAAMTNTSGNSAVARLMYHCGVAVSMNYGPTSSSAYSGSVATAMRTWFDYTNGLIVSKSAYPEENWENLLRNELDNSRPVYYSGRNTSGHAFVLDGYQETNYFHVNWGWGGSYNGYFYLSSLSPGSMDFSNGQQAIVGMIPSADFTGPDFGAAINVTCKMPVSGDLSSGTALVNYYGNTYPAVLEKEVIYTFTTSLPGRITIKITDQTGPVYVFLLDHPSRDSVITYGLNGLVAEDMSPGTYYVAVESQDYSEPQYVIEVICPTPDADLDIQDASVNPSFVQSLQENVALTSTLKNIGNSASASCFIEFFISSDNKFDQDTDSLLGAKVVPALSPGASAIIDDVVTMPDSLLPGIRYILFIADRENVIPEADEENSFSVIVTVPDTGIIDCSSSFALTDEKWHYGNTLDDGINQVENWSQAYELTGPEVIHDFISPWNGMMRLSFVDKSPGILYAMLLPVCNENTVERSLRVYDLTDTLVSEDFYVIAGTHYYIVVDGDQGAAGDYGLFVDLPGQCPVPEIEYWGNPDHCEGDPWPELWTSYGYNNYRWYRDGVAIDGATRSSYSVLSPGSYQVKVTENGCQGASEPIIVRSDAPPDTARIACTDTTRFCMGSSVTLDLDNSVAFPLNWARDGMLLEGAQGSSYNAFESGSYSLYTINGVCRVKSENSIEVTVIDPPADIGENLPVPSEKVRFFCTFDEEEGYEGGITQKYMMVGWDYLPVDDRFGNFWKARYLEGVDQKMYWSDYDTIPGDYTISLWFKTVTAGGGVIAGFYDNTWEPTKMESLLWMSDNGKIHFRLSNGTVPVELSTSGSWNDGEWHCVTIQHRGKMVLEIDDNLEWIESADSCTKDVFAGYWTFGGPVLPAGVSETPSSLHFCGSLDDILCLDEAYEYTASWMVHLPVLEISFQHPVPECVPATATFRIPYSQRGTEYRVWDRTRSLWAPLTVVGDGGTVLFGNAALELGTNEFQIMAKDLTTDCEQVLDTIMMVNVASVCTVITDDNEEVFLKVYPVPAGDVVHFESDMEIMEVNIIDVSGRIIYTSEPYSTAFEVDLSAIPAAVYFYNITTTGNIRLSGRIVVK